MEKVHREAGTQRSSEDHVLTAKHCSFLSFIENCFTDIEMAVPLGSHMSYIYVSVCVCVLYSKDKGYYWRDVSKVFKTYIDIL